MFKRHLQSSILTSLMIGLIACSQTPDSNQTMAIAPQTPTANPTIPTRDRELTPLFSRVWRVSAAPSQPTTSIYVFLANGTFLQTSCGEPYRIATWTIDPENPRVLQVVEDGQLAFTAEIVQLTDTTLQLQQNLVRSNERRDITLMAVEEEFVCPDLPR